MIRLDNCPVRGILWLGVQRQRYCYSPSESGRLSVSARAIRANIITIIISITATGAVIIMVNAPAVVSCRPLLFSRCFIALKNTPAFITRPRVAIRTPTRYLLLPWSQCQIIEYTLNYFRFYGSTDLIDRTFTIFIFNLNQKKKNVSLFNLIELYEYHIRTKYQLVRKYFTEATKSIITLIIYDYK